MNTEKQNRNQRKLFFHIFNRPSYKTSFQSRLIAAFFIIAAPIMLIVCVGSFLFLTVSSATTTKTSQAVALEKAVNQIQYMAEASENLSKDMIFNNSVQALLSQSYNGELFPDDSSVAYFTKNFVANRDFIDSAILTGTDKTLYSTERAFTNVSSFESIQNKYWYDDMISNNESCCWFPTDNGLLLCRKVYNLNDYVTLYGYIMLYMNDDYIDNIWDSVTFGETTNMILLDKNETVLLKNNVCRYQGTNYTNHLSEIRKIRSNEIIRLDGRKYVVGGREFTDNNWVLYMITPYHEVNSSARLLRFELLLLFGVVVLILILVSRFCASAMAQPIVTLAKLMDTFHGEEISQRGFPSKLYETRPDEIGDIYRSFKKLTSRMDTLIEEIYIKNLEKKDAELAVLQSQINPHFLYNTLDSINWMALANGQDEISDMVTALSDTFRLSLMKTKSPFTPLSQEIEYVKSYLTLQKFRYSERLHYSFQINKETLPYMIPKFILQPIVENALKHGIDHLEEGGELTISSKISNGMLLLTVTNDGDGIDVEKITRQLYFDPEHMEYLSFQKGGYGVQNIHRRICIICGTQYGLSFSVRTPSYLSETLARVKTNCTIRLPLHTEEYGETS